MLLKSLILSILILTAAYMTSHSRRWLGNYSISRSIIWLFIISLGIYFVFAFIIPIVYYYPINNGVLGDNYLHLERFLNKPGYVKHHHPLFPLLPDLFVRLTLYFGILDLKDSFFLEKVFQISVLLISLSMIGAISIFSRVLFKMDIPVISWFLVTLFISLSFGVSLWGNQSNAIGLGISLELILASIFIVWYKKRSMLYTALLAASIGISVFFHNGLIYLATGSFIASEIVILTDQNMALKTRVKESLVLSSTLLLMAIAYYVLQAEVNETYNFTQLFNIISDAKYFGDFQLTINTILGAIESNFWSGINWISGFYYNHKYPYWADNEVLVKTHWFHQWVKAAQIGGILSFYFYMLFEFFWLKKKPSRALFIFGLCNSIVFFIGFTLRQSGTHYYVLALIPNLMLMVAFVIGSTKSSKLPYTFSMLIIILGTIYFNLFTSFSVFEGADINEHPYYSESSQINTLSPTDSIYHLSRLDMTYYPNMAMAVYYKPKFGHIRWISYSDKRSILDEINKLQGKSITINEDGYELIKSNNGYEFESIPLGHNNIYLLKFDSP